MSKSEAVKVGKETVSNKNSSYNDIKDQKKPDEKHLNTKALPAIVMLAGGGTVAITVFVRHFSVLNILIAIFIGLVVFLIIGDIIKAIFDHVVLVDKNAVGKDGEMIEKSSGTDKNESEEDSVRDEPSEGKDTQNSENMTAENDAAAK